MIDFADIARKLCSIPLTFLVAVKRPREALGSTCECHKRWLLLRKRATPVTFSFKTAITLASEEDRNTYI